MATTDYREAFHTEIKSFLKNLCKAFDDDRDLLMITSSLLFALQDDPKNEVITQFRSTVLPHKKMVDERDPAFFGQVSTDGTEYKLLSKLNEYWERLSAPDQKTVWDYIHVLLMLSGKVV
jgi:hypothetical protein